MKNSSAAFLQFFLIFEQKTASSLMPSEAILARQYQFSNSKLSISNHN